MDLKEMMVERLRFYQSQNDGKLPERILVYRNGIPEVGYSRPFHFQLVNYSRDYVQSIAVSRGS